MLQTSSFKLQTCEIRNPSPFEVEYLTLIWKKNLKNADLQPMIKRLTSPALLEIVFHVLFWVLFVFVISNTFNFSFRVIEEENGVPVERLKIVSILPLVLMRLPVQLIFFYGNIYFLLEKIYPKSVWKYGLSVVLVFSICLYAELWIRALFSTLYGMDILFYDKVVLGLAFFFYSLFFGISFSYFLIREWRKSERRIVELRNEQLSTELKFLRSQLSPHFLFNTLNGLFAIAQRSANDEVADGISKMSKLLRYSLYESNVREIALEKEIDYLRSYIELAKMRFAEEEVDIVLKVEGKLDGVTIAPMLLVPFVENAFKHGVRIEKSSKVCFDLTVLPNEIKFAGSNRDYNDNVGLHNGTQGIGLSNVQKRLQLLYPTQSHFEYKSENGFFKFTLAISR